MDDKNHDQNDDKNWARAKQLFIEVLELAPEKQQDFVLQSTTDSPKVREYLEELLYGNRISSESNKAVSRVVGEQAQNILKEDAISQKGERIAEYEIIDTLGEGGMGVVYLAHRKDAEFEQSVAIKIIQSHAYVHQTLERFRQERQILASLQHPNIAQLVGGGETNNGLPYIVMEYIDGVDIVEYCRINKLSIEQRLDLFKQVLSAVSYAHQNLIIHRDIKPSNVMVTGSGVVKLLDFGIAKLIKEKALPANQNLTALEVKVLTYANASPEQVRKEKVTTRTDVYGLSALLYQMLTENPLFETTDLTNHELESWIIDKLPTKPSANVSTVHSVATAKLQSTLSGDLDTIILKGLQKEPARRYGSVDQLAQDIQHYLTNYPILAKPDSSWYKIKKFYQRNKAFTIMTSALSVSLIVFSAIVSYQAVVIESERKIAVRESSNAYQVTQFLSDTFQAANPLYRGEKELTPLDLIDNAAKRLNRLQVDDQLKMQLMGTVATVYKSVGAYDKAIRFSEDAFSLSSSVDEIPQPLKYSILTTKLGAQLETNNPNEVEKAVTELIEQLLRAIDIETNNEDKKRLQSSLLTNYLLLGVTNDRLGKDEKALESILIALELAQKYPDASDFHYSAIYTALGHTYRNLLKLEESADMLERSLAYARTSFGEFNLEVAYSLNQLSSTYFDMDRFEEAKEAAYKSLEIREALYPRGSAEIAASLGNLAKSYSSLGDKKTALMYRQRSVDELKRAVGDEHIYVAASTLALALYFIDSGQYSVAENKVLEVLPIFENTLDETSIDLARPYRALGRIYYLQQDYQKAITFLDKAMSICQTAKPDGHWITGEVHSYYALVFHAQGRQGEAFSNKEHAIALYRDIFGADSPKTINMKNLMVEIQSDSNKVSKGQVP